MDVCSRAYCGIGRMRSSFKFQRIKSCSDAILVGHSDNFRLRGQAGIIIFFSEGLSPVFMPFLVELFIFSFVGGSLLCVVAK